MRATAVQAADVLGFGLAIGLIILGYVAAMACCVFSSREECHETR